MRLPFDVLVSAVMGLSCAVLLMLHRFVAASTRYGRVTQQGGTFFLGLNLMHAGYWMLQPVVRWCAAKRVSPSLVTWLSLIPALAAAVSAAVGHWGIAAWFLLASALSDVLDGAIARETGAMSAAGAVLDSVLDRYAEFIFFAGLFVYYRNALPVQLLILAAMIGSFLVSYSSAKAEAMRTTPPRGSMKRSDRLTVLVVGTAVAPWSQTWLEASPGRDAWPVVAAIGIIAVFANLSAVQRFIALARAVRPAAPCDEPAAPRDEAAARHEPEPIAPPAPATVRRRETHLAT